METPRLPSAAHTHQASRPPRDTDCPQGKERPPGTRDGTTLPSAVRPAPRPRWRRGYRAPRQGPGAQPGSRTAPSPQAAVATARAAARPAQPQAAESETSCGRAPGRALPLSHRSARQPGPARCGRVCAVVCAIGAWGRWPHYPVLWGGGSGARPCTPHGNRAAALSPGPSGARRDSWVRGRSAPLECFRGRRPGSRPFQSDLCNFNSNLKQVRHVLGHIQVLPQPQGLRGGERPPRACPAALLVCRGRGQAPVQELVAVLTLGLQHWEAPHPAWASSGPWGGNRRQEALEPPALLYLDIPEPRSSAWPAAAPEHAAMEGQGQESQTGNLPEGTDAGPLGGFLPSDRNVRAKGCTEARGPAREPPPGAPQQAAGCWATDGCARRPRGRRAPAQHRDRAQVPPHVQAPGRAGTPEPRSQGRPSAR